MIELREEIGFFNRLAAEVRKITTPDAHASPAAEQAVRQFMSEGLAAGEIVDVLAVADQDRPEISVLSDEFLDSIATKTEHPNVQIRLLEKLLKGEVRSRSRTNRTQAKLFSEQIEAVLRRYELRQISSAEVVERLVEIAKSLRDARRRHEQLGLSVEEAAFYDALAGGSGDGAADPQLAPFSGKRRTTGMKEGNERVLRRRSSSPRWPRPCVGDPRGRSEALDRGARRPAIEPRNRACSGCRRGQKTRKATPLAAFSRAVSGPRGVGEPVHACDLFMLRTGRSVCHERRRRLM